MPEFITLQSGDASEDIEVIQIWCDPRFPEAHRDPKLRAFLERRANEGVMALVRFGSDGGAIVLIAPCLNNANIWIEHKSQCSVQHSVAEIFDKFGYQKATTQIV